MHHRAAFPVAGVVVELGHLVEAQLFVVVGSHPFGRIDRALLQGRVNVGRAQLLRDHAELGEDQARHPADAHLEAFQVGDGLDLLAVPAAHLAAGVARHHRDAAVVLEERRHGFRAAAEIPPGVLLASVSAEGDRRAERERRILAEIVVRRRVAAFRRPGLDGVEHLQRRDDLASGERTDLELAVRNFPYAPGDQFRAAIQGVQALGPACAHAPGDGWQAGGGRLRIDDGWRGGCSAGSQADSGFLQK